MLEELPKWNLNEIYSSEKDPEIKNDLEKCKTQTKSFIKKYSNKLNSLDAKELGSAISEFEKINQVLGKLYSHASLSFAINMATPKHGQHYQKIKEFASEIFSKLIFFELELMNLDNDLTDSFMSNSVIKKWTPWIRRIIQRKPFQLSNELEIFIAEKGPTGRSAWVRLFDESSTDLRYNYREKMLTETEVLNLLTDKDPDIRKDAGLSFSKTLKENLRTRSLIINTISRDKHTEDKKRGFENPISSRNLDNDVEDEVVEALTVSVTERFKDLSHRYYKLKASWFNVKHLNWWDRNAPLPKTPNQKWKWKDARNLVLESFSELSPEISDIAEKFFKNNWIDAEVRTGKDSGAFAHPTVPDIHPYILLNYTGKSRDVMTLAHELGHGVHQVLSGKNGYLLSDTPLTLAETASVFGEMLVFQKLLSQTSSPSEKKFMLASKVEDMLNTVVRQVAFHNFETDFHNSRKKNELTPDQISDIWMETQSNALGESIKLDESYRPLWAYIPHFIHTPFYVYAYAFGDCLVNSLWQVWQKGEEGFTEKYLNLLKSGGTLHHKEALKPFGLDAANPKFWDQGLNTISNLIDQLEDLRND